MLRERIKQVKLLGDFADIRLQRYFSYLHSTVDNESQI
jgi:hypothetical protein